MFDLFGNQVAEVTTLDDTPVSVIKKNSHATNLLFSLTDAYFMNDKRVLWTMYRQLISTGYEVDEMVPIIWW